MSHHSNPTDKRLTYCLPLLIVNFGVKKTIAYDIGDMMTHNYVCNHWEQDNGQFEPYGKFSNEKLERQFMKYIQSGKIDFQEVLINLVRYIDDKPQNYLINFKTMIQVNSQTKFTRKIERRTVNLLLNSMVNTWEFEIGNGIWQKFDTLWQGQLENNFKQYLNGIHHNSFQINLAPRPEIY